MIMAVKETLYYAHYSEHLMHLTIGTQCVRAVCIYLRITCDSVILSTKNWVVAVFICMRTCTQFKNTFLCKSYFVTRTIWIESHKEDFYCLNSLFFGTATYLHTRDAAMKIIIFKPPPILATKGTINNCQEIIIFFQN